MAPEERRTPSLPFTVVMRGYERDQVAEAINRYNAEMRVLAADRDAAAAHSRQLGDDLEAARATIDDLRTEIDKLAVAPSTLEGASERISNMFRLAQDEASEARALAAADAAEMLSVARQEADALLADATGDRDDAAARRRRMETEHLSTMDAAHAEAARIVAEAQAEADRLDAIATANRERVQEDFDLTMAQRRDKAIRELTELDENSRDEAQRTIADARADASEQRRVAHQHVRDIQDLRARLLDQLSKASATLDRLPELLAELDDERVLTGTALAFDDDEDIDEPARNSA